MQKKFGHRARGVAKFTPEYRAAIEQLMPGEEDRIPALPKETDIWINPKLYTEEFAQEAPATLIHELVHGYGGHGWEDERKVMKGQPGASKDENIERFLNWEDTAEQAEDVWRYLESVHALDEERQQRLGWIWDVWNYVDGLYNSLNKKDK